MIIGNDLEFRSKVNGHSNQNERSKISSVPHYVNHVSPRRSPHNFGFKNLTLGWIPRYFRNLIFQPILPFQTENRAKNSKLILAFLRKKPRIYKVSTSVPWNSHLNTILENGFYSSKFRKSFIGWILGYFKKGFIVLSFLSFFHKNVNLSLILN